MKIFVSYYVDYPDQAGEDGYYVSEEAALRRLRERYAPPYEVTWDEPFREDGRLYLRGHFEAVPGKSTKHEGLWEIYEVEVEE